MKSRRQLLQITKNLTNGMVGREDNFWKPIKQRIKMIDPQVLFDRMDKIQERRSSKEFQPDRVVKCQPICSQTDVLTGDQAYESATQYNVESQEEKVLVHGYDFENAKDFHHYYQCLSRSVHGQLKAVGGWGDFDTVFMISALHGDGVEPLKVSDGKMHSLYSWL